MTELEKCNAGLPYSFADPEMIARKSEAIRQCEIYNAIDGTDYAAQYEHLKKMLGAVGERVWIAAGEWTKYGPISEERSEVLNERAVYLGR